MGLTVRGDETDPLGCAMLFKNATKTLLPLPPLLHPFHYFSDLRSFCESTFWCCFGSELVHGPSGAPPPPAPATIIPRKKQSKHTNYHAACLYHNRDDVSWGGSGNQPVLAPGA